MLHGWDNASVISFRPGQTATFVCFTVLHNKLTAWLGRLLLALLRLLLPQLLLINVHLYLVVHKALCENEHDVTAVIRQWGHRVTGTYMWLRPVPPACSLILSLSSCTLCLVSTALSLPSLSCIYNQLSVFNEKYICIYRPCWLIWLLRLHLRLLLPLCIHIGH